MKNSEIFWSVFGVILLIAINIAGYKGYKQEHINSQEKSYCGIVKVKSSEEISIKHGTRTELYLIVDFDEIGELDIYPNNVNYHSAKVGDRVCYILSNFKVYGREGNFFFLVCFIIGGIIDFILFIVLIIFLINNFNNLIDNSW